MMDGVTEGMIVGSSTEVIAGEKMIITAGAIDAHVHYICVDLWREVCRFPSEIPKCSVDLMFPGTCVRHYHPHRRWNRPLSRNQRYDLHLEQVLHEDDDVRHRWHPLELWIYG